MLPTFSNKGRQPPPSESSPAADWHPALRSSRRLDGPLGSKSPSPSILFTSTSRRTLFLGSIKRESAHFNRELVSCFSPQHAHPSTSFFHLEKICQWLKLEERVFHPFSQKFQVSILAATSRSRPRVGTAFSFPEFPFPPSPEASAL